MPFAYTYTQFCFTFCACQPASQPAGQPACLYGCLYMHSSFICIIRFFFSLFIFVVDFFPLFSFIVDVVAFLTKILCVYIFECDAVYESAQSRSRRKKMLFFVYSFFLCSFVHFLF